jgi:hypothetical protein
MSINSVQAPTTSQYLLWSPKKTEKLLVIASQQSKTEALIIAPLSVILKYRNRGVGSEL